MSVRCRGNIRLSKLVHLAQKQQKMILFSVSLSINYVQ